MDIQAEINELKDDLKNTTDINLQIAIRNQLTELYKHLPSQTNQAGKFPFQYYFHSAIIFEYIQYIQLDIFNHFISCLNPIHAMI